MSRKASTSKRVDRFIKVSAKGKALPRTAKVWDAVYDRQTKLMFPAQLGTAELPWKEAMAQTLPMVGGKPARVASRMELLTIIDDTRFRPAVDKSFFRWPETGWVWTCTKDASAPAAYAWYVALYNGTCSLYLQSNRGLVVAVRGPVASPGQ